MFVVGKGDPARLAARLVGEAVNSFQGSTLVPFTQETLPGAGRSSTFGCLFSSLAPLALLFCPLSSIGHIVHSVTMGCAARAVTEA